MEKIEKESHKKYEQLLDKYKDPDSMNASVSRVVNELEDHKGV